jgi:low affinity Fe/Cu permease
MAQRTTGETRGSGTPRLIKRDDGSSISEAFRRFAQAIANAAGTAGAFAAAIVVILAWALTGPLFGFSDTWQLVINTGTTIITFLMVFVIQNTQNRDSRAMHAKLDELVVAGRGADNRLVEAEDLSEADLARLKTYFVSRAQSVERAQKSPGEGSQQGRRRQNGSRQPKRQSSR